jgi:hypothetical protein
MTRLEAPQKLWKALDDEAGDGPISGPRQRGHRLVLDLHVQDFADGEASNDRRDWRSQHCIEPQAIA